jgi:HAD superfamily hydrolase (TIGR01509 family)
MTIKAVAWDIDGTLIESEAVHHRALLAGTAQFGVDLSGVPEDRYRGVQMPDVWQDLKGRLPHSIVFEDWLETICSSYLANAQDLAPIDGAVEAVETVSRLGLPQVCVSNSNRSIVDTNLAFLGVQSRLAFSISLDDVANGKPDPEPYLLAAQRLRLAAENIIAVEDSLTGVLAALNAGMAVVGYRLPPDVATRVAHNIDHFAALPGILRA